MKTPCDTCKEKCPYAVFIDCPIWQNWAYEQNHILDEQEDEDGRQTVGDT